MLQGIGVLTYNELMRKTINGTIFNRDLGSSLDQKGVNDFRGGHTCGIWKFPAHGDAGFPNPLSNHKQDGPSEFGIVKNNSGHWKPDGVSHSAKLCVLFIHSLVERHIVSDLTGNHEVAGSIPGFAQWGSLSAVCLGHSLS
uniref:Uncharacterized protein n=1 Tax=Sus scrofa TaxID=9823 RepID=A0A8D1P1U9_PIG